MWKKGRNVLKVLPSSTLQMVERKREARPGVAGSKNAGRPTRLMGGKEDARRNIPAPMNNELMEALVRMCVQLLHDPAFCNAKVGARCLAHVPREHRARELMPYHRRSDGLPPVVARELMVVAPPRSWCRCSVRAQVCPRRACLQYG